MVDVFLLMSAMLASYLLFHQLHRNNGKLNILSHYIQRYIRFASNNGKLETIPNKSESYLQVDPRLRSGARIHGDACSPLRIRS